MSDFMYLMQGRAGTVSGYFHLGDRERADAIFLTWDEPLDGAEYYPESTWAQGRNRLLELALKRDPCAFYVFCDDDIAFQTGSWGLFEQLLLRYRPAVTAGVAPRITRFWKIPLVECQGIVMCDEQLVAFHRNTVLDGILLPYQERFDHLTAYATGEIQGILIRNLYAGRAVHFNRVVIENLVHEGRNDTEVDFRTPLRDWLKTQFRKGYRMKDLWRRRPETLVYECWYTLLFYAKHYFANNAHPTTRKQRLRKLDGSSIFLDGV